MQYTGVFNIKTQSEDIMNKVLHGELVTLTVNGQTLVELLPLQKKDETKELTPDQAFEQLKLFRKRIGPIKKSTRKLIESGRA